MIKKIFWRLKLTFCILFHFVFRGYSSRASSLAYTNLLCLVPFFILVVIILSHLPLLHSYSSMVQKFLLDHIIVNDKKIVVNTIIKFVSHVQSVTVYSVVFFLVMLCLMLVNISLSLNSVWGTKHDKTLFKTIFIYLSLIVLTPILLAFGLLLVSLHFSYLSKLSSFLSSYMYVYSFVISFGANFIFFTLLSWLLLPSSVSFFSSCFSAFITSVLLIVAKKAFVFYVNYISSYNIVYGAMAAIPFLLIWLYFVWLFILIGSYIAYLSSVGVEEIIDEYKMLQRL